MVEQEVAQSKVITCLRKKLTLRSLTFISVSSFQKLSITMIIEEPQLKTKMDQFNFKNLIPNTEWQLTAKYT